MGKNVVEKIIGAHLVSGTMKPGNEVGIKVDQTLTQDATGTMAFLQFETMGIGRVKTKAVTYVDHNVLQEGYENADDHKYLRTVADKYGVKFSPAGNGICHQVHLERFSRPGEVLLGADSHTTTCGGAGMFAVGVGGLDVAVAMGGGAFFFTYPQVVRVNLTGELRPWCSAKDIILELLKQLTTKGNVGTVVEYGGSGLEKLTVPERATIANMGAELGVTTSVFPSDAMTSRFFHAQARDRDWRELLADEDAAYDRVIDLDLNTIEPNIACPHAPDHVRKVKDITGLEVNQVMIGSCTNSSYRDIMLVAAMLKGRHVNPRVSVGLAPGSRQVLAMIAENGALNDLLQAGVRLLESACGFCLGIGQAPQSKAVSVRTNNRNFPGRSATKDAQVYLVSPETAAATALTGQITDPRALGMEYPVITLPEVYHIDDGMIIEPSGDPATEIYRGPNIGEPPKNTAMPDTVKIKVATKVGDITTTDHLVPAGSLLKYRSNVPKYAEYVLCNVDPEFPAKCRKNREQGFASAIVAGVSYGQGSSREHAALLPMYLGVRVVLAKSVERIHAANLINFGILQLNFADEADYDRLEAGDELMVADIRQAVRQGTVPVKNVTKGYAFQTTCSLTPRQAAILLSGGALNYAAGGGK
jgi:aconitate hydratase, putative, Aquifex type